MADVGKYVTSIVLDSGSCSIRTEPQDQASNHGNTRSGDVHVDSSESNTSSIGINRFEHHEHGHTEEGRKNEMPSKQNHNCIPVCVKPKMKSSIPAISQKRHGVLVSGIHDNPDHRKSEVEINSQKTGVPMNQMNKDSHDTQIHGYDVTDEEEANHLIYDDYQGTIRAPDSHQYHEYRHNGYHGYSPQQISAYMTGEYGSTYERANGIYSEDKFDSVEHSLEYHPRAWEPLVAMGTRQGPAQAESSTTGRNHHQGLTEYGYSSAQEDEDTDGYLSDTESQVTGEHGQTIYDVVEMVAMEHKLASYRLHLASSKALLDHNTEVTGLHGNEICVTHTNSDHVDDHRLDLVRTLLRRERLYQQCLHNIFDVYAEPLRKFSSLCAEDHYMLFSSLEPILSLSTSLCIKLSETIQTWDPGTSRVGNLFSKQYWLRYDEYYKTYTARRLLLKQKRQSDQEFAHFCRLRQGAARHSLDSLLLLPVQRVPDYDGFLSRLLEDTSPTHPDYEDLSRAATRVRAMVEEREEEVRHVQNDQKMDAVQERFPNDNLQLQDKDKKNNKSSTRRRSGAGAVILKPFGRKHHPGEKNNGSATHLQVPDTIDGLAIPLSPQQPCNHSNRIYILEGSVHFTTACQTQDRYLFLFNDLLLVAKQRSNNLFKLKQRVRVCEMWLADCIEDVAETVRPADRSFVLGWPTTNCVATFSSPSLMEVWRDRLASQVKLAKAKEERTCIVRIRYVDPNSNCQSIKSLHVANDELACSLVHRCVEEFHILGKDASEYQLWASSTTKDDPPYPLFGHEHPYSIRKGQERDWNQEGAGDGRLDSLRGLDLSYFTLQTAKKKPRDLSLDDTKRNKKVKKSPLNIFKKKSATALPSGKLFCHSLTTVSNGIELPEPIKLLLVYLFQEGLYTVGVFRKPGSQKKCQEIIAQIDNGEDLDIKELTIPVASSILKDYLKRLPNCVLDCDLCDQWIAMTEVPDATQRLNHAKKLVECLPRSHQNLLRHLVALLFLVSHCQASKEQGMDSYALSVCISQVLLWRAPSKDVSATQALLSAESIAGKVVPVVRLLIDNCQEIFSDDCVRLFGDLPVEVGKPRQDSSTDSDSMHSLLSLREQQCVGNRDNLSLDSLDRDCYYPEMDSSPQLVKSHLSPTNLSRDSGLTLSDTQLYEDGTESEHSSIPPKKQPPMSRSYSQLDENKPSADPGKLSSSHDGSLLIMHKGGPVAPPRKAKRRSAGAVDLEAANAKVAASSHDQKRTRSVYPLKRASEDSTLGSLDEEYPSDLLEDLNKSSTDIGIIRKSESGAHLYISEDVGPPRPNPSSVLQRAVSREQRAINKEHRRSAPPLMYDAEFLTTETSKPASKCSQRTDFSKLGSSLDYTSPSDIPIPENQVLSLSSTFPSGSPRKSQTIFSVTPPDSPDIKAEVKDVRQSHSLSDKLSAGKVSLSMGGVEVNTRDISPPKPAVPKTGPIQEHKEQSTHGASSTVQMRFKTVTSVDSVDRSRKGRLMRSDAIDSTVLRKTVSAYEPVEDPLQTSPSGEDHGKLRKGMTASGADKFPATIPLRTSLYSLEDVTRSPVLQHKQSLTSQGTNSCRHSDSYSGGVPSSVDRFRQRAAIEKSISDTSVSNQFELAGPVKSTGKSRPQNPPTYAEAIQRKTQKGSHTPIVPKDSVAVQQTNSAKAKKLYEESLKKYENTSDTPACCSPHTVEQTSPRQELKVASNGEKSSRISKKLPSYEQACQLAAQIKERRESKHELSSMELKVVPTHDREHRLSESPPRKMTEHVSRNREPARRVTHKQEAPRRSAESRDSPLRHHGDIKEEVLRGRRLDAKHRDGTKRERAQSQPRLSTPPSSRDKSRLLTDSPIRVDPRLAEISTIMDRHQNLLRQSMDSPHDINCSRSSSFSSRESTPSRASHASRSDSDCSRRRAARDAVFSRSSPPSRSDSDVSRRRDNQRVASRSRERRPGQRYSDPKLSNSKVVMTNVSRSKSDTQDHLDKVGKFKQLKAFDNNKENVSMEDLQKATRSNRSTPERKSSDERIKSHSEERNRRKTESVLKTSIEDGQTRPISHERRRSVPSVRNKDWHKELASQYKEKEMFYVPQSENRHDSSLVQFGYSTGHKQEQQTHTDSEPTKRRWTPPLHPTKDLIYVTKEENKRNMARSPPQNVVQRSGSPAILRNNHSSQDRRTAVDGHDHLQKDRPRSVRTDNLTEQLREQYKGSDSTQRNEKEPSRQEAAPQHRSSPISSEGHRGKCDEGLNWSVAKLRGLYAEQKAHSTQKNSPTTPSGKTTMQYNGSKNAQNTHFYIPGGEPPVPGTISQAPWRSNRGHRERTNPNADEAYI